jgi:hypothetical protein
MTIRKIIEGNKIIPAFDTTKTRRWSEVKTLAQKADEAKEARKKPRWTEEATSILKRLVAGREYASVDWADVAKQCGRIEQACKKRAYYLKLLSDNGRGVSRKRKNKKYKKAISTLPLLEKIEVYVKRARAIDSEIEELTKEKKEIIRKIRDGVR